MQRAVLFKKECLNSDLWGKINACKGYIFPLILMATLSIGLFVVTIGQLQVSHKKQFNHLNQYQHCFNIAYSALVEQLSDIKKVKWINRKFKGKPFGFSSDLYGGSYNLLVEDHATNEFEFNVKVRVVYQDKPNLFYWRLKYEPSLLDFNTLVIPIYFGHFPDSTSSSIMEDLNKIVDEALKLRGENDSKARELATIVDGLSKNKDIIDQFAALPVSNQPKVLNGDADRTTGITVSLVPNTLDVKNITQLLKESEGGASPTLADVISALPLTDIYPDKINVNVGLTRKEIVLYFIRIMQLPEDSSQAAINAFNDITDDTAFNRALSTAFEIGLVKGYPNGDFGPDDYIMRGHLAMILIRINEFAVEYLKDPTLSDVRRSRMLIIKKFAQENEPVYYEANPAVSMTVGDGLAVLSKLLEEINAVQ